MGAERRVSAQRDPSAFLGLGEPNALSGAGRDPSVLALHGFSGTPQEVALVTQVARRFRLRYSAPLLPGHGTNLEDLAASTWHDWRAAADAELDVLSERGPAIVAGLSMGAVLALEMAVERPRDIKALVLMSNAISLPSPYPHWALAAADRLGVSKLSLRKSAPDILDPIERRRHLTYNAQPISGALELWRAGARVKKLLSRVECPLLILHGRCDRVCSPDNARLVAEAVSSRDVRVVYLSRSHHIITRDVERPIVYGEVCEFVQRFVPERAVDVAPPG